MAINLEGKVFTTIDGRVLLVSEFFQQKDFATDAKGSGAFVKHDALLRVCKELFVVRDRQVNIVTATPTFVAATVAYDLIPKTEETEKQKEEVENGERKSWDIDSFSFQSSADCTPQNAPPKPADIYFTAMAETRASGRALRFLLGVDFCTKEEIAAPGQDYVDENEGITDSVIGVIEKKFMGTYKITMEQIRKLLKKTEEEMPELKSLTKGEGSLLMAKLNQYLNKLRNDKED